MIQTLSHLSNHRNSSRSASKSTSITSTTYSTCRQNGRRRSTRSRTREAPSWRRAFTPKPTKCTKLKVFSRGNSWSSQVWNRWNRKMRPWSRWNKMPACLPRIRPWVRSISNRSTTSATRWQCNRIGYIKLPRPTGKSSLVARSAPSRTWITATTCRGRTGSQLPGTTIHTSSRLARWRRGS